MSSSLRPQRVVLDSLPTPMFPSSPSSRVPEVSRNAGFHSFAVPPTPEFSPMAANNPFQSFGVGQTGAQPQVESNSEERAADQTEAHTEPEQEEPVKAKTIVMCFDGTGNMFGRNSNVVRFFRALIKDRRHEQVVYYQPGVGTYNKHAFITRTATTIASGVDSAIALHLDDHVKEGYKYLIQTYRPGDKICLFGFSRGAHTARVVAGMLYKVGIIPKENIQQVDFAFNIYSTTGYEGYKLSHEFKQTFASPASVEFVGVWDTVSSVGIIPRMHPYTSINYGIKTFRHALALDERRCRFRPNVWSEVTPDREQELDVDIPEPKGIPPNAKRDDWAYLPPNRDFADVEEVWFAGCHADVGGGSHSTRRNQSLSFIPLRWMIKECILAKTGILFDMEYLKDSLDFDVNALLAEMQERGMTVGDLGEGYKDLEKHAEEQTKWQEQQTAAAVPTITVTEAGANGAAHTHHTSTTRQHIRAGFQYLHDAHDNIFDQLILAWVWWLLEFIPTLFTFQDSAGNWIRLRRRNFGRGRYIPFHENQVRVHESVEQRINNKKAQVKYTPKASNWKDITPMIKYVK